MHIVTSTLDEGEYCLDAENELEEAEKDFCSRDLVDSYLRVYSMLLGDFELHHYTTENSGLTFLFTVFTMIGVVILLNLLIAVIIDLYEKARIGSLLLFGRARVAFVAQNQALESFLRGQEVLEDKRKGLVAAGGILRLPVVRWLVLLSLIATAVFTEVYLLSGAATEGSTSILTKIIVVALSVILTVALWIVLTISISKFFRGHLPDHLVCVFDFVDKCAQVSANFVASRLFGLREKTRVLSTLDDEREEEEWTSRTAQTEKTLQRLIGNAKKDLDESLFAMESRLTEHRQQQQPATELENTVQNALESTKTDFRQAIQAMEGRLRVHQQSLFESLQKH